MTPEEFDRKMEFVLDRQAEFAVRQERDHAMLVRGFEQLTREIAGLRESAARFQSSAADLFQIQSARLDRQDEFYRNAITQSQSFQRQTLHLLNLILDRLPPRREIT